MTNLYFSFVSTVNRRFLTAALRLLWVLGLLAGGPLAQAQQADSLQPTLPLVQLENIDVTPGAVDTKGWLVLDADIRTELEGAVHNLYNLKFEKAEKQFRSLRRRYPQHPMPYFLLGMSQWWKMMPANLRSHQYDAAFTAYMDTAVVKGEALYGADNKNYEACFFLSAAYGFEARLQAERKDWRKATVSSKRALDFLEKSQEANGLSPEFLFGQGLMNYYAPWIADNYPLLRPVLWFFPKGNRQQGLKQLQSVADNAFYTAPETKLFLARIYFFEENNPKAALPLAKSLAESYPDNAYFERFYAMTCYKLGYFKECERVSRDMEDKLNRGLTGYEATTGRFATFYLGQMMQGRNNLPKAREYYQRCISFARSCGETRTGYYLQAHWNLAKMAEEAEDWPTAARYYSVVRDEAEPMSEMSEEAKAFFKNQRGTRKRSSGVVTPQQANARTLVSSN